MLTRSVFPKVGLALRLRASAVPRLSFNSSSLLTRRHYAQSWDSKQPNDKVDAHIRVQKLLDQIHEHPQVVVKLNKFSELMVSKGLVDEKNPPGPWQMIKILTDKEVRNAMAEFKVALEDAKIELGPDQLGPLLTVMGIDKKP